MHREIQVYPLKFHSDYSVKSCHLSLVENDQTATNQYYLISFLVGTCLVIALEKLCLFKQFINLFLILLEDEDDSFWFFRGPMISYQVKKIINRSICLFWCSTSRKKI